ncbi:MAG TPA: hypothetical protein VF934_10275 [Burkholderiales bacterium]
MVIPEESRTWLSVGIAGAAGFGSSAVATIGDANALSTAAAKSLFLSMAISFVMIEMT